MYKFNGPIRIVEREENFLLINIPKIQLSIEVNKNVVEFFEFLSKEKHFCKSSVDKFIQENDITNGEEYKDLFEKMVDLEVLVSL